MTSINIEKICEMLIGGATYIANNYEYIDQLNIFPVPDGDTGSNMKITTEGAADAIKGKNFDNLSLLAKAYSRALLMNARGNSGVIFSQIMKGFVSTFKEGKELSLADLCDSFDLAAKQAYKSLSSPVEGTILTVICVTAEQITAKKATFKSIEELFAFAVKIANETLQKTPEMLQELKNAGVVDSGGCGLCKFIEGMNDCLLGKLKSSAEASSQALPVIKTKGFIDNYTDNNEGFGYCCEFIMTIGAKVSLNQKDKEEFSKYKLERELKSIGDCLVIVVDENIVKVHVHSLTPYRVLEIGAKYGEFMKVKIENMTLQFLEKNENTVLGQTYANKQNSYNELAAKAIVSDKPKIIATVPSEVLKNLFMNELKVDVCINYETSGNPSIQEFLNAFKKTKSSQIICVVDDFNAVLACKQAIELVEKTIKVVLINARNISISYLTCLAYNPMNEFSRNAKILTSIAKKSFATVAQANKKVKYDNVNINSNDYIGIFNKKVVAANKTIYNVMVSACTRLIKELRWGKKSNYKLIIFAGRKSNIEDINKLQKMLSEKYSFKTSVINTDQEIYFYHFCI